MLGVSQGRRQNWVGHVLPIGPTPKGPGELSDVRVRRDSRRSPGVVSFQGSWGRGRDGLAGASFPGSMQWV